MKKKNLRTKAKWLIFVLLVFGMGSVFSAECGDVDSNGTVQIIDALVIAQAYVGLNPTNYNPSVADVSGDNEVDIIDALLIAQYYVGLLDSFPGCKGTPVPTSTPVITNSPGGIDCSGLSRWSASMHYEKAGTRVYFNGKVYENNWYSVNENPEQNSSGNAAWTLIGPCDPNRTPAPTTGPLPTVTWTGKSGYATRFWDCCKPHCSWAENVPAGMKPLKTCKIDGKTTNPDVGAKSSCEGGDSYVCFDFIPWAVTSSLSYGFAATSSGDICGKCYELQFTGEGKYDNTPGAVALRGKRMIIQAINIGYDVSGGQFDILVPGGGVGAFDGCTNQWGISNNDLGAVYGGLLTACMQEYGYYNHTAIKNCLRSKNDSLFHSRGLTEMAAGLDWFIDWYEAADNPKLIYREVTCPQELIDKTEMKRP